MVKFKRKAQAKRIQQKYNKLEKTRNSTIKKIIKDLKGRRFTGQFVCDLCKHTQMTGYLYTTDDTEYEICKFCHDALFNTIPHVKVIYTPMGNKR